MNISETKSFGLFITVWVGQFISCIGNGLTAFTLGVYAFDKTQSAIVYSLIILFAFLPSYLLKPIGGYLSDRFDRRLMMIIGDFGSAMGLVFILLMFAAGNHELWVIYLGVALSSVFTALQNPAYKASVTDLVDESAFSKASGLMQLAESSRFLISPVIAGFLILACPIEKILMIDIATFLIAVASVYAVKKKIINTKTSQKENIFEGIKAGFRYIFAKKNLVWLLFLTTLITFAVGFLQSLMGPMILAFTDAKMLGLTQSVSASGMIVSSLLIGLFSRTNKQLRILSYSLAFTGLFYALFGASTNIIFITIAGFFFFTTLPFVNTSLDVLIRKNVDNDVQARVWSIVSLVSQMGMVIAFSTSGFLADKVFNPLLMPDGTLASSAGKLIGTGAGRGIGLMFVLSGTLILITAYVIVNNKPVQTLEKRSHPSKIKFCSKKWELEISPLRDSFRLTKKTNSHGKVNAFFPNHQPYTPAYILRYRKEVQRGQVQQGD
ncbi:MAG: transporter, family, macrolide efflux protein [Eubacteriaceae bacterium]|jgi:MFS family permease|nr:transporter, family, macrolide efflux protein [Eubacteriaceae bacterium]